MTSTGRRSSQWWRGSYTAGSGRGSPGPHPHRQDTLGNKRFISRNETILFNLLRWQQKRFPLFSWQILNTTDNKSCFVCCFSYLVEGLFQKFGLQGDWLVRVLGEPVRWWQTSLLSAGLWWRWSPPPDPPDPSTCPAEQIAQILRKTKKCQNTKNFSAFFKNEN